MAKRLNTDDLRLMLNRIRADLPTMPEHGVRMGLANHVLLEFLIGHLHGRRMNSRIRASLNAPFYRRTTTDGLRQVPRRDQLANSLLAVQDVPGFERYLTEYGKHKQWEPLHFELQAACILRRAGILAEIVVPNGTLGESFDFWLDIDGSSVACEVKSKLTATAPHWRGVESVLGDAKVQLPAETPGIIWLTIPAEWQDERSLFSMNLAMYANDLADKADQAIIGIVVQSETVTDPVWSLNLEYIPATYISDLRHLFDEAHRRIANPSVFGPRIDDVFQSRGE